MEQTNSKIAKLIREELGSIKVMILAIMMSFGLVLAIVNFIVNTLNTLEMANNIKNYVRSPYDAEINNLITMSVNMSFIVQVAMFFVSFIPFAVLAFGVYLTYANSKQGYGHTKTTGLKVVGGVMKYHGVVAFMGTALSFILGLGSVVLTFGFGDKVAAFMGVADSQFVAGLRMMSIMAAIVGIFVGILFAAKGAIFMSLAGNMRFMSQIQHGNREKIMSGFGIFLMIIAGVLNFLSIFSSFSGTGLTVEDIEMLEETLGGQVAQFITEIMPSDITQFQSMVVGVAYSFFVGVAQLLAGITLMLIRAKVNHTLQEQEYINYGGDNFTGSN